MVDKIFKIFIAILISALLGIVSLVPSYLFFVTLEDWFDKDPHPHMPTVPIYFSVLYSIVVFGVSLIMRLVKFDQMQFKPKGKRPQIMDFKAL